MDTFGERLKQLRTELHMSQAQLGAMIGLSAVSIMRYEKGMREPSFEHIQALSKILDVTPEYLAGWQVYKKPDAWVMQSENPSGEVIAKLSKALKQYRADSSSPKPKKTRTKLDGHSSNQEADRKTAVVRNMTHLLRAYELLNDYGKQVAVERLLELAQIPAYQSTDFSEEAFKTLSAEVARHPGRMQINGFHQPEENKSR